MAKILIVDDLPLNLDFLEEQLLLLNHEVEKAIDGNQALDQIRSFLPDLVLLDYDMPEKNGVEVLEILRKDESFASLPVIMITAKRDHEDRLAGIEAGADDYITKPFHMDEVATRIRSLLRLRDLQQQIVDREKKLSQVEGVGQTLVTLAHHINNATQAIAGMAQLCGQAPDNLAQHQQLASISLVQSQKITAVIDSLQEMVDRMNLKTADYAGDPDKMFDIEADLKKRLEQIEQVRA
ncbi:MAG: response regulator [Candidatus Latescibacteria bacterium]|nr:response regulator [Candidatus Latescibacterota bacterium]